jgi:Lar family restriction alleviation protein
MVNIMAELKPCPFCDGEAKIAKTYIYGDVRGYTPYCNKCGCELQMYSSKQAAKNAWNRRCDN